MKIKLMANRAFENQRMLMDLNGTINYVKTANMFIKNNEVGVYEIERYRSAMSPEEKEAFWKEVSDIMATYYDVEIKKDTFYIYKKGEGPKTEKKAKDKLNTIEDKKEDDNNGHKETVIEQAKTPAKRKVSSKSKKVQTNK